MQTNPFLGLGSFSSKTSSGSSGLQVDTNKGGIDYGFQGKGAYDDPNIVFVDRNAPQVKAGLNTNTAYGLARIENTGDGYKIYVPRSDVDAETRTTPTSVESYVKSLNEQYDYYQGLREGISRQQENASKKSPLTPTPSTIARQANTSVGRATGRGTIQSGEAIEQLRSVVGGRSAKQFSSSVPSTGGFSSAENEPYFRQFSPKANPINPLASLTLVESITTPQGRQALRQAFYEPNPTSGQPILSPRLYAPTSVLGKIETSQRAQLEGKTQPAFNLNPLKPVEETAKRELFASPITNVQGKVLFPEPFTLGRGKLYGFEVSKERLSTFGGQVAGILATVGVGEAIGSTAKISTVSKARQFEKLATSGEEYSGQVISSGTVESKAKILGITVGKSEKDFFGISNVAGKTEKTIPIENNPLKQLNVVDSKSLQVSAFESGKFPKLNKISGSQSTSEGSFFVRNNPLFETEGQTISIRGFASETPTVSKGSVASKGILGIKTKPLTSTSKISGFEVVAESEEGGIKTKGLLQSKASAKIGGKNVDILSQVERRQEISISEKPPELFGKRNVVSSKGQSTNQLLRSLQRESQNPIIIESKAAESAILETSSKSTKTVRNVLGVQKGATSGTILEQVIVNQPSTKRSAPTVLVPREIAVNRQSPKARSVSVLIPSHSTRTLFSVPSQQAQQESTSEVLTVPQTSTTPSLTPSTQETPLSVSKTATSTLTTTSPFFPSPTVPFNLSPPPFFFPTVRSGLGGGGSGDLFGAYGRRKKLKGQKIRPKVLSNPVEVFLGAQPVKATPARRKFVERTLLKTGVAPFFEAKFSKGNMFALQRAKKKGRFF